MKSVLRRCAWKLMEGAALGCMLAGAARLAIAAPVTGIVTDRTTGKVSAGDRVALIGFDGNPQAGAQGGMRVMAETTSDSTGRYRLEIPDTEMHLVRVSHQKAAYFQSLQAGTATVNVDVYDVAPEVDGITTEADVLSVQTTSGGELQVTEDYFVRNSSQPARTQLSDHAYEFYLPEGVKLAGTAAQGPGGLPVSSSPVPLAGKGHYAFVFPLRPGQTRFQVSYTLPYSGKALGWTQREAMTTENLVVLLPKSMRFAPEGTDWQPVPANPEAQTFVRKGVAPAVPVAFQLTGEGQLPRDTEATGPNGGGGNTPGADSGGGTSVATRDSMATDTRPGGGLGPPVDTPDPLDRYKPWLLGGLGVLLLAGAGWLLRGRPASDAIAALDEEREPATDGPRALRPALERALLALEREHALGIVGAEEYAESRGALQRALHRALAREAASLETAEKR